ncbi:MAG: hypothetical protein HC860_01030 [Alkalinema sp. RU_4_3]|nr:hypothetical protein [Alkalinema sp. RU_4_3]
MDSRFTVEVLSQTSNPQQTIYAAMHQDYAEEFVAHGKEKFPGEAEAGDLVIKYLLGGNRGISGRSSTPKSSSISAGSPTAACNRSAPTAWASASMFNVWPPTQKSPSSKPPGHFIRSN